MSKFTYPMPKAERKAREEDITEGLRKAVREINRAKKSLIDAGTLGPVEKVDQHWATNILIMAIANREGCSIQTVVESLREPL